MPGLFPIAASQLAGVLAEAILYGINLTTCIFCAKTLLLMDRRTGRQPQVHRMMASIAIIFFLVSTWDMALGIMHLFRAFIKASDPTLEFDKLADWINIARNLNQSIALLLGDFMLIYRCWVVYERRWKVMIPSLILYLAAIAMGIKVFLIEIDPHIDESLNIELRPWYTTQFGVNAAQNVLTTGMLVWRIWRVVKNVNKNANCPMEHILNEYQGRPVYKAMRVVAESGMVYTATVLATFLVSSTSSNAIYIVADVTLQTAGIVFNVILIRCHNSEDPTGGAMPMNGRACSVLQFNTDADSDRKHEPEIRASIVVPCATV